MKSLVGSAVGMYVGEFFFTLIKICFIKSFSGGAAGAVSRITGTVGKGVAALTFDEDYQKKRQQMLYQRSASAHEGFFEGGKGLIMVLSTVYYFIQAHFTFICIFFYFKGILQRINWSIFSTYQGSQKRRRTGIF